MKNKNTRRESTQRNQHIIICPPCGERVAQATKEGQNKVCLIGPLLPRLTAVLPPQGREMSSGFTLIELLVVVLIIGILAAVALPQYQKAVKKAKTTEIITALDAAEKAFSAYYLEHGTFQGISQETLPMKLPELTHFKYQVGTFCSANDATTSNKFEGPYNGYSSTSFGLYFCDKKEKWGVRLLFDNSNITKQCGWSSLNLSQCKKYLNL